MPVLSNENIQRTFADWKVCRVISSIDYFPNDRTGQCHMYSYPYTLMHYNDITHDFSGGLFHSVQIVTLFDERPFEHEFFMRIAKEFPCLKQLTINNSEAQNSNNEYEHFPVIEYPHLIYLSLFQIHDDYVEQFLLDTKTCFFNDISLSIRNDVLQRVIENLTRDATGNNYSKVKSLYLDNSVDLTKFF